MGTITDQEICDAIRDTLKEAASLFRWQSYNELSEGMPDTPTLQVYWETDITDPTGSADRLTFKAGMRLTQKIFHADLYACQRKHLGEDMEQLLETKNEIEAIILAQNTKPYFGLDGIKAFQYSATRVTFNYGDPAVNYVGARFAITITIF